MEVDGAGGGAALWVEIEDMRRRLRRQERGGESEEGRPAGRRRMESTEEGLLRSSCFKGIEKEEDVLSMQRLRRARKMVMRDGEQVTPNTIDRGGPKLFVASLRQSQSVWRLYRTRTLIR